MRELFSIDLKDYKGTEKVFSRPSARALIEKDGQLLLIYSKKYDFYKCPGGGIEGDEDPVTALIREVKEETGYDVIRESVKEFGYVSRRHLSDIRDNEIFEQINYYYVCDIEDKEPSERSLEEYEVEGEYIVKWVTPIIASRTNHYSSPEKTDLIMVEREEKILDLFDLENRKNERLSQEQRALEEMLAMSKENAPDYEAMLNFVKAILEGGKTERTETKVTLNYSRFDHTKHVLGWARKLYDEYPYKNEIDYEDVMIATIFHDVGRLDADALKIPHAKAGIPITEKYLTEHGFSEKRAQYIASLVGRHSDKHEMGNPDIDKNLLLLMEADLLDDAGALAVVMDCMITEGRNPASKFEDSYDHLMRFTHRIQQENLLVTDVARKIWDDKTALVNEFCRQLQHDLEM